MKKTPVSVPESKVQKFGVNRKFKDALFRMIFQEKNDLLELYNAINDSSYTDPNDLTITTLEDVIFLGMKNDLSFLIDSQLNLYEHQSTWNENMPLRGLFYFTDVLRAYVEQNDLNLYREKRIPLPLPKYIVFYNGETDCADQEELCLSASFPEKMRESASLECRVTVLNINKGHNAPIMAKSKRLSDYAYFVQAVRDNIKQAYPIQQSIIMAVNECIRQDVLADILRKNRAEVIDLFMTTYDADLHKKAIEEEARETGWNDGWNDGWNAGNSAGEKAGRIEGEKLGRIEGEKLGRIEGEKSVRASMIRAMLLDHQSIELIQKYTGASDEEIQRVAEKWTIKKSDGDENIDKV